MNPFKLFFPIFVEVACNPNGIYKGVTMWLLYFFMEKKATTALSSRIALDAKLLHKPHEEGTITPYCEVVNYLLKTYATNDIIMETDKKS